MNKLKLENEIREKLYLSYGRDIFEGKEFPERTIEDWGNTFRTAIFIFNNKY